jgi:hypothetical protein
MEQDPPAEQLLWFENVTRHPVWETAIWMELTHRRLVRRHEGWRFVPADQLQPDDAVLEERQLPCHVTVRDDGRFDIELTDRPTNFTIYDRGEDLEMHAAASREALAALYLSF